MMPGEMTEEDDLKFTWELSEFTSQNLALQIDFGQPLMVSSSGQDADKVKVTFKESGMFLDEEDGEPLEANLTLTKAFPRQYLD